MLRRGKKSFSRQTEGHYVHLRYVNVEGNVKGANFSKVAALPNGTTLRSGGRTPKGLFS